MFIICNGKYNKELFTLKKITFLRLLGYQVDKTKVIDFLSKTVYNPNKYPENLVVIVDSTKEELEAEW